MITNNINGKFYIGVHKGPMKHYWGSGKALKGAITKYGKQHFRRVVLFECPDAKTAYALETIIVNKTFIERNDTYNMSLGGCHGPDLTGRKQSQEQRDKVSKTRLGKPFSLEHRMALRTAKLGKKRPPHTDIHRKRIGDAHRGRIHGEMALEHRHKIRVAVTANWRKRKQMEITP